MKIIIAIERRKKKSIIPLLCLSSRFPGCGQKSRGEKAKGGKGERGKEAKKQRGQEAEREDRR